MVVKKEVEGLGIGPVLCKCPYCKSGFRGDTSFQLATKHIREKHQKTGARRGSRKRDPYDFLNTGSNSVLLEEASV